jgi:hypothetical protein
MGNLSKKLIGLFVLLKYSFFFFVLFICKNSMAQETPVITPSPVSTEREELHEIRPLPGALDTVLMFNSNSPEVVKHEGILLSTFSPKGKAYPNAHLNYFFQGKFKIFAHHINDSKFNDFKGNENKPTLFIAALLNNESDNKVKIIIDKAYSYLSVPDAPFIALPDIADNDEGKLYSGPGDRLTNDFLRKDSQKNWTKRIILKPHETKLLFCLPIPIISEIHHANGRSTLVSLKSDGPVQVATLALFAKTKHNGVHANEIEPTFDEWMELANNGNLAGPRDKTPSLPGSLPVIYGRVAGVQQGAKWEATLCDSPVGTPKLEVPPPGKFFTYPISTVDQGTFGTGQIQSAPLLCRYSDTAYAAHGNYCVEYDLTLPLVNTTSNEKTVAIKLQTPLKSNLFEGKLKFLEPPAKQTFFRGTVELKYRDDKDKIAHHFWHLVEKRGQASEPLVILHLKPNSNRKVEIRLFYPPDCTPPQVLTVQGVE